jgi:putative spermidine/putrescine transport system substrate-binding protein
MRTPKSAALTLVSLLALTLLAACGSTSTGASTVNDPTNFTVAQPVNLQVIDAGGYVPQFAQTMMDAYAKAHPDKVAHIEYLPRVQAPDLPGKIKAQQDAGHVTTSIIVSGYDGVASCIKQGLVEQLTPTHSDWFPNLNSNYLDAAKRYNDLANGYALVFSYTPSGPLFEYDPAQVSSPPQTIDDLKAWIIAHPKKFLYAVPRNSGPGRTLLMGLPYILGDSNPADPVNGWTKTWQFLKDVKPYIATNPSSTSITISGLANGTNAMIASTFGWEINPKALKQEPATMKVFTVQGTQFVADAAWMMMPKGLDSDTQKVVLDMMHSLLQPAAQALTYDKGYFYPGPAIKNVPISMAPADSQSVLQQFAEPSFDSLIANTKINLPLSADNLVTAFQMWDTTIGGS